MYKIYLSRSEFFFFKFVTMFLRYEISISNLLININSQSPSNYVIFFTKKQNFFNKFRNGNCFI